MDIIIESFLVSVIAMVFALSIKLWWSYYDIDELLEILKRKNKKPAFTWKTFALFTLTIIALFEAVYWVFVD